MDFSHAATQGTAQLGRTTVNTSAPAVSMNIASFDMQHWIRRPGVWGLGVFRGWHGSGSQPVGLGRLAMTTSLEKSGASSLPIEPVLPIDLELAALDQVVRAREPLNRISSGSVSQMAWCWLCCLVLPVLAKSKHSPPSSAVGAWRIGLPVSANARTAGTGGAGRRALGTA